jgi:hypothetical protein
MTTATFTEFLRTPKQVVADTAAGAVRITRRGDDDLMLLRASDLEQQEAGVALASRLIRARLAHADMAEGLRQTYPWTALFTEAELSQFAAEMDQLVWAATDLGRYAGLLLAFRSWEGTAEALADGLPRGLGEDLTWLEQPLNTPRP